MKTASRMVTAPVVSGVGDGEGGARAQTLAPDGDALNGHARARTGTGNRLHEARICQLHRSHRQWRGC